MTMKNTNKFTVSTRLLELVKEFEGFRAKAYKCVGGALTVGYGHTGKDVTSTTTVTRQEALDLLNKDLLRVGSEIAAMAYRQQVTLTHNRIEALTSLAFNIGTDSLFKSTLWRKIIIDPDDASIETQFNRWVYANKVRQPGLVNRRRREYELYSLQN